MEKENFKQGLEEYGRIEGIDIAYLYHIHCPNNKKK